MNKVKSIIFVSLLLLPGILIADNEIPIDFQQGTSSTSIIKDPTYVPIVGFASFDGSAMTISLLSGSINADVEIINTSNSISTLHNSVCLTSNTTVLPLYGAGFYYVNIYVNGARYAFGKFLIE